MTFWEWFLAIYLFAGFAVTLIAGVGHQRIYGCPLHWSTELIGLFVWPVILLSGKKKK